MAAALTITGPRFNPFNRIWAAYERSLRRRPVLTQAVSSALLWGLGDAMAQRIETRGRGGIDSRRVALTAAFGGAVIGPSGHGWYLMLDKLVLRLGLACSVKSMLLKVSLDNLLYMPGYVLAFFAFGCMAIDGLSPTEFAHKMRQEFVPTLLAEAVLWPPYMAAVFSRVAVKHQLLAVNVATLFDVCFLSWVRAKDDAEEATSQQQQQQQLEAAQRVLEPIAPPPQPAQQPREPAQGSARVATRKAAISLEDLKRGPKQQQQEAFWGGADLSGAVRLRDSASQRWPWDASSEESLGRLALMAASATCSTPAGGGFFSGLLLAPSAGAASASGARATR